MARIEAIWLRWNVASINHGQLNPSFVPRSITSNLRLKILLVVSWDKESSNLPQKFEICWLRPTLVFKKIDKLEITKAQMSPTTKNYRSKMSSNFRSNHNHTKKKYISRKKTIIYYLIDNGYYLILPLYTNFVIRIQQLIRIVL